MQYKLLQSFGTIDIYLFDQLLKGTYEHCEKVLDVGCGGGRNLVYFLNNDFDVYGVDQNTGAIEAVRELARSISSKTSLENFSAAVAEDLPFESGYFDLVICSAMLHFANSKAHFEDMLTSMWRVLKPGGYFFARLASDIGIENKVNNLGNGRYLLPDGSERFLVNEQLLLRYTQTLNGQLHEPIKTTNVQNLRCMTTWCLQKQ
ncbi:MAG TPA: class I SAM-dependent methyltransferase [Mucilaginibacter sp.]|jgi:ubiquinone/menaquinone biosynthesis C-methylase UbiE